MTEYQVIARKYRPQAFSTVLGQDAIVTTLKNAIKQKRLAHAYLFCGSRGTGKTTLARVFAKALNCQAPGQDMEPCNHCSSCKEIATGNSLDVLEIDGASHRGIDDIRQINETVGYSSSSGKYKIYIIDEVHMLTKEAFNALLKTLEEPPPKVIFLFATTEPQKVLPTILSRCQRFNLNRISIESIIGKLRMIADEIEVNVQDEALRLIAQRADGGLRDAESLFDQIIAFHEGTITETTVSDILGTVPRTMLFTLDRAAKEGRLNVAFELAHLAFSQGKDIVHFVESLTEHFRTLLLFKLSGKDIPFLSLSETDTLQYEASAKLYTQEQCLSLLDFLIETQNQIRFQPSGRIALEAILLRILRIHQRLPIEFLIKRLSELEQAVQAVPQGTPLPTFASAPSIPSQPSPIVSTASGVSPINKSILSTSSVSEDPTPSPHDLGIKLTPPQTPPSQSSLTTPPQQVVHKPIEMSSNVSEDPIPTPRELGIKSMPASAPAAQPPLPPDSQSRLDTLLQFAAVELEGTVQKKHINLP